MKTQFGKLVTADLQEGTLTIDVGETIIAQSGKYAVVPIDEYRRLVNGVDASDKSALPIQNVRHCKLIDAEIGEFLVCIKDVKPAKNYKVGEKYEILDKRLDTEENRWGVKGLQIETKEGKRWIPFKNHYRRWGVL